MNTLRLSMNGGPLTDYVEVVTEGGAPPPPSPTPPPPPPSPTPPPPVPIGYFSAAMQPIKGAPSTAQFGQQTTIEYSGVGMQAGSNVNANTLEILVSDGDTGLWTVGMVPGFGAGASFVHWSISKTPLDLTGTGGYKGPERDASGTNAGNFSIGFGGYPGSDANLSPGRYYLNIVRVGPSVGVDNKLVSFIKQA
jgi:hypothetical protein